MVSATTPAISIMDMKLLTAPTAHYLTSCWSSRVQILKLRNPVRLVVMTHSLEGQPIGTVQSAATVTLNRLPTHQTTW